MRAFFPQVTGDTGALEGIGIALSVCADGVEGEAGLRGLPSSPLHLLPQSQSPLEG